MSTQLQSFDEIICDVQALLKDDKYNSHNKTKALQELIKQTQAMGQSWLKSFHLHFNALTWEASFKSLKINHIGNQTDFDYGLLFYVFLQIFNADNCYQAQELHQYIDDYLSPSLKADILALPEALGRALQAYKFQDLNIDATQPCLMQKTLLSIHAKQFLKDPDNRNDAVVPEFSLPIYQPLKAEKMSRLNPYQIGIYTEDSQIKCQFQDLLGKNQTNITLDIPLQQFTQRKFIDNYGQNIRWELQKNQFIEFLTEDQVSLLYKLEQMYQSLKNLQTNHQPSDLKTKVAASLWSWFSSPKPVDEATQKLLKIDSELQDKKKALEYNFYFINYLNKHATYSIYQQDDKLKQLKAAQNDYVKQKQLIDELHQLLLKHFGIIGKISQLIETIGQQWTLSSDLIKLFKENERLKHLEYLFSEYAAKQSDVLTELSEARDSSNKKFLDFNQDKIPYLQQLAKLSFNPCQQISLVKDIIKIAVGLALVAASALSLYYSEKLISILALQISLTLVQVCLGLALAASLGVLYIAIRNYISHKTTYQADIAPDPNSSEALFNTASL